MDLLDRSALLILDGTSLAVTLRVFSRSGASRHGLLAAGLAWLAWLGFLHVRLAGRGLFPDDVSGPAFLAWIVAGVAAAGLVVALPPVRTALARLEPADLLELQVVRILFGATFVAWALEGTLPRVFGAIDGVTHATAGLLALVAASRLRRGPAPGWAWLAHIFGLGDILVVASSVALVLLPVLTPHHPMMLAVFLPAPFWAVWHLVSMARLVRRSPEPAPGPVSPRSPALAALFVLAGALAVGLASGRALVLRTVMGTVEPYFHGPGLEGARLEPVTKRVWSYRYHWYRNLVVATDEGLVVVDPMGSDAAASLRRALDETFPGKPVARLVYSHYHLDHVRGGAALAPREVLAHEKCPGYWAAAGATDVLPATRLLSGDQDLSLGGVTIRALYMGPSHTDTLYAFLLPEERVLFTADLGLVRTVAPTGVPDRYAPGYAAALDRLAKLDFDVFVPSHFGIGTKRDLEDWRDMLELGRTLAREAVKKRRALGVEAGEMGGYFDDVYYPLRARYGSWHGFDAMAVLNIVRDLEGEELGH